MFSLPITYFEELFIYIHTYWYIYFYPRTLTAPPSRLLAHTGARYEISDLREIYGEGRRNSAGSSGGCSSGGGPQSAPLWRRVRRSLAPRSSLETRGVPSSGAGPSQNGTCSEGGIGRKIRAGRSAVNYFRFGRTPVCFNTSQSALSGRMGSFGTEPQQAVVSWLSLIHI